MSKYSKWYDITLTAEAKAIRDLTAKLDYQVMDKIVDLLLTVKRDKKRVVTIGCGTSGTAARRIAHTLSCIEIPAAFLSPAEALHGGLGFVQKDDLAVLITKGGNTSEVAACLPCLKAKGSVIIGVTHNASSILAREADITLLMDTGVEPCPFQMMPCSSTMGVIAAWDAMILSAMRLSGFTKEAFLAIHPGGATGEVLRGECQ
jgi:D-arabinose 5-phosphate isomerase GutQ